MKSKLTQLDINTNQFESDINFTKTMSAFTPMASTISSGFKYDSPKMFQRKPSFKTYQRRQRKDPQPQTKICYISPQKSDIFKKYGTFTENRVDLNSSNFTNNSSQIGWNEQYKRHPKQNNLLLDLNQPRTILTQINNLKMDSFRTPKNGKSDINSNFISPINLIKLTINKLNREELNTLQNKNSIFDKDFESLIEIKDFQSPVNHNASGNYFKSQTKISKKNSKHQKQNFMSQLSSERSSFQLKNNFIEEQCIKLKAQCAKLKIQKSQLQESSRLFLQQVKDLQSKLQISKIEKQKANNQINALKQKQIEKNNLIQILEQKIKNLENSSQLANYKMKQHESNENYKILYFQLSQKLKYLTVQNGILKKFLQDKKDDQFKINRLQNLNKKLTAKNKYLNKQIQDIQKQLLDTRKESKLKKPNFSFEDLPKNKSNARNSLNNEMIVKNSDRKSVSVLICNESQSSLNQYQQIQRQMQNVERLSIISNGSSLQLSFELSPQKNHQSFKSNNDIQKNQLFSENTLRFK